MMGLAACGGGDETTSDATAPAPAATSAAAPAAAATTEAAPAAAPADKVVCEDAEKASSSFKKAIFTLMGDGATEIAPADAKLLLADFAKGLTAAASGSTSEAGKAVLVIAEQATAASESTDPINAADTPETAKAGKALNAACKTAGVKTNF